MGINRSILAFGILAFGVFLFNAALAIVALSHLHVGGHAYNQIALSKDLVGDILPPPEYVIEANLEAAYAMEDPASLAIRAGKLQKLHHDFDDRYAYWMASDLPANLKADLEISTKEADHFWHAVEADFLPALKRGDRATAEAAYRTLRAAYSTHRMAIDHMSEDATAFGADAEAGAKHENIVYTGLLYTGSVLGVLMILAGTWSIRRMVVVPLAQLTEAMTSLADGELGTAVPSKGRRDEIGAMAGAVQTFKDAALEKGRLEVAERDTRQRTEQERAENIGERLKAAEAQARVVTEIAHALERLASGELTHRIGNAFAAEYDKLRIDFNAAMGALQKTISAVASTTTAIRSGSHEISVAADDLSKRTEQQAANLEETAAALDQITVTIRKTADGARQAREVVAATKVNAEHSGEIVRKAVDAMGSIDKSSEQISQIIGVIDEIAFQTNLLALNAGVEAARAGEAGRGFAVVASEVRALAQRSAEAAKDIKALISTSSAQVKQGVDLVDETGVSLARMVEQVAQINRFVSEMATSAQDQATGLSEINIAIGQLDQITQQNAAMVEETTAASHRLAGESRDLVGLIGGFDLGMGADAARHTPVVGFQTAIPAKAVAMMRATGRGGAARKPSAETDTSQDI